MIDLHKIETLLPAPVYDQLFDTCTRFNINTPLRLAHFLAQCDHESAHFSRIEENLNYSAKGLMATFRKYFDDISAESYAHNRIMIASRVYADRMGNGDEDSQDGWMYRGRGYLQLTGKDNYRAFDAAIPDNILEYPDFVATKYPLMSAGWYWGFHRLNEEADMGSDQQIVANITRKINGGYNGLQDRQNLFDRYWVALDESA